MRPGDIAIPKLYWSKTDRCYLSFKEILDSAMGNFRYTELFEAANIKLIESAPDEIQNLAMEMLDAIDGGSAYTVEDEVAQGQFVSLMRPGHFTYGSGARMGRDFLRKYSCLIFNRLHSEANYDDGTTNEPS
jgi:hypothetical protein